MINHKFIFYQLNEKKGKIHYLRIIKTHKSVILSIN